MPDEMNDQPAFLTIVCVQRPVVADVQPEHTFPLPGQCRVLHGLGILSQPIQFVEHLLRYCSVQAGKIVFSSAGEVNPAGHQDRPWLLAT